MTFARFFLALIALTVVANVGSTSVQHMLHAGTKSFGKTLLDGLKAFTGGKGTHMPVEPSSSYPTQFITVKYYYSSSQGSCPTPVYQAYAYGLNYCTPTFDTETNTTGSVYVKANNTVATASMYASTSCSGKAVGGGSLPIGTCTPENVKISKPTSSISWGSLDGLQLTYYSTSSNCNSHSNSGIVGATLFTTNNNGCLVVDGLINSGMSVAPSCASNGFTETFWNTSSTCKGTPTASYQGIPYNQFCGSMDSLGYPYVSCVF